MPLVIFISLIQLMDNFRVFEPIVGFSAQANATSLSFIIFNDLRGDVMRFNSAAATSVLTILGVTILLLPVLIRTWRDFKGRRFNDQPRKQSLKAADDRLNQLCADLDFRCGISICLDALGVLQSPG